MSVEDLKELYKLRWGIKVNFNALKHRLTQKISQEQ